MLGISVSDSLGFLRIIDTPISMSTARGAVAVSDRKACPSPARCRLPQHDRQLGDRDRQPPVRRLPDGQPVVSA
jgi:hypothetical protein